MLAHPQHHVVLAVDSLGKGALAQAQRAILPCALHCVHAVRAMQRSCWLPWQRQRGSRCAYLSRA